MTADGRPLRESLEDYLALRRALGFRLKTARRWPVRQLARKTAAPDGHHRRRPGMGGAPAGSLSGMAVDRLAAVRGFAACLHGTDPSVQVPPPQA